MKLISNTQNKFRQPGTNRTRSADDKPHEIKTKPRVDRQAGPLKRGYHQFGPSETKHSNNLAQYTL